MDVDTYVALREQNRKVQLGVHVGLVFLFGAAQATRIVPVIVGLVIACYLMVLCMLVLYVRLRPDAQTPSCRAQVPGWVLDRPVPGVRRQQPGVEYTGNLFFSRHTVEWRPSPRFARRGVRPVLWDVRERSDVDARSLWGLVPLTCLRVRDVTHAHPDSVIWLSVKPSRLQRLLSLTMGAPGGRSS